MKVRMNKTMRGLIYGQVPPPAGEVMTIPNDAEAARYCELGYCEPVAEKPTERAEKAVPSKTSEKRRAADSG